MKNLSKILKPLLFFGLFVFASQVISKPTIQVSCQSPSSCAIQVCVYYYLECLDAGGGTGCDSNFDFCIDYNCYLEECQTIGG